MKSWTKRSALAGLTVAMMTTVTAPAMADEGKWTVGVSGGTLGIGPEIAYRFNDNLGVRVNGGFYSYDDTDELDDIEYDAELKLNSFGAMLDWYPGGGGFRISLGGRVNNNEIELAGTPTTAVEIGDATYSPAQVGTISGKVTTDSFAPALTLGYGGKLASGFAMGVELGVMLQGSPEIEDLRTSGLLSTQPAFLQQLAIEEERMEEDGEDFKLWPIFQLHFLYRF